MSYALILASKVDSQPDNPPVEGSVIVQCLGCNEDVWLEPGPAEQAHERNVDQVIVACTPCFVSTRDAIAQENVSSEQAED